MPPKPRPILKPTAAAPLNEEDAAKAMPPPPDPPHPTGILEPEMKALSSCLQNATRKTGQIYQFHYDIYQRDLQRHVSEPPRALTASLGREVEKYDQLCDAIEAQLLRAVSVLQRDLAREERRLREAEAAAAPSPVAPAPPTSVASESMDTAPPTTSSTPRQSPSSSTTNPMSRRPSNISISSLHRAPFPLKIDLPSPSLRMTHDETSLYSSTLASPINLGPGSAQAMGPPEFNAELMAAFASAPDGVDRPVEIDLTLPDTDDVAVGSQELASIGNTADQPIELDLDPMDIDISSMTDLFGDSSEPGANSDAFSSNSVLQGGPDKPVKSEEDIDIGILDALGAGSGDHGDLFGHISGDDTGGPTQTTQHKETPDPSDMDHGQSPGSMLASFEAAAANLGSLDTQSIPDGQSINMSEGGFEFLGQEFFSNTQNSENNPPVDFNALFSNMGGTLIGNGGGGPADDANKQ